MKSILSDLLFLIFGKGDENYVPTKKEYFAFALMVLIAVIASIGLSL